MEQLEKDWIEYPILHLDLNTGKYDSVEQLMYVLDDTLHNWELLYGRSETEKTPELRFKGIVRRAYEKTGRRVVILVDEYDKPLLQAIGDEVLQEEFRNMLKTFYGVLKTMDWCDPLCLADRCYEVWQSKCVQRFEQLWTICPCVIRM